MGDENFKRVNSTFLHATDSSHGADDTVEMYRTWAKTYDQDLFSLPNRINIIACEQMLQLYPERRGIRILDCGAGTGQVGDALHQHGFRNMDALEPSEEMLEEAKKTNVYQNLICDFLGTNRLPIEDNTYDCIVGVGIFAGGHCKADCIPEMIRVVKPGGKIYISTREVNILTDPHLSVHLEAAMQRHHDNGDWKWLKREIVPNYLDQWNGFVSIFEVL